MDGRPRARRGAAAPRDESVDVVRLVEHRRAAESAAAPREETPRKTWARLRRRLRSRVDGARGYSHEQMTWRDIMIVAAISALLAAAITVALRIVIENLTF
jgi:hypothetical protein